MVDPIVRTVTNMMKTRGGDATLIVTSSEYDPATSEMATIEVTHAIRVLAFDYTQKVAGISSQDGTLIKTGDKQIFIRPDPLVPVPQVDRDYIEFQGKRWLVKILKEVNPSGTNPMLYEVYARY